MKKQIALALACLGWAVTPSALQAQCVTANSDLVHWWPANGTTYDYAPGTQNSTLTSVTYGTNVTYGGSSYTNTVWNFNGSTSEVNLGGPPGIFKTNNFTIEYWMKAETNTGGAFMEKRPACDMDTGTAWWGIRGTTNFVLELAGSSLANYATIQTTNLTLNDGQWHHMAWTREGTSLCVYVDGQLNNSNTTTAIANLNNTSRGVRIGSSTCEGWDGTGRFRGSVDEMSFYSNALSSGDILALYQAGSAGKCPIAPVIYTEPTNERPAIGTTANFDVVARCLVSMSYQWYSNNVAVSGGGSRYSRAITTADDPYPQEDYYVVIQSTAGNTTSKTVNMRVKPTFMNELVTQTQPVGTPVTLSAEAKGTANANYSWKRNNVTISGQTTTNLALAGNFSESGTYLITASNSDGSDTSTAGVFFDCDGVTTNVLLNCGLLSYWKMDETSSTRQDSTGRNFDLSVYNSAYYNSNGVRNGCVALNASPDKGLRTTSTSAQSVLAFSDNWAVSSWVYHTNMVYDSDHIFSKAGEVYFYVENYNTNEHLHAWIFAGTNPNTTLLNHQFSYVLPRNEWHHIVLQRNDGNIELYVDGQLEETVAISGTIQNFNNNFWIGMQKDGWPWNGSIDEVGVWGRYLTADEISTLYGAGTPPAFEDFLPE